MLERLINWLLPSPTFERERDNQVRKALSEYKDTGNALFDSFAALVIEEDAFEIEQALMLAPEDKDKNLHYFIDRWRNFYVNMATVELNPEALTGINDEHS